MTLLSDVVVLFVLTTGATAVSARVWPACNRILFFTIVTSVTGLGWLALQLARGLAWEHVVPAFLFFACLCEFMVLITMTSLASISVRMLCRVSRQPLNLAEMSESYSSESIVDIRLTRLLRGGTSAMTGINWR